MLAFVSPLRLTVRGLRAGCSRAARSHGAPSEPGRLPGQWRSFQRARERREAGSSWRLVAIAGGAALLRVSPTGSRRPRP
jgi:hypothetical protein